MPNTEDIKQLARNRSRDVCARSASFRNLDFAEQKSMFEGVYQDEYTRLMQEHGLTPSASAQALATQSGLAPSNGGGLAQGLTASDLIDDKRHLNRRIDQAGNLLSDFVDDINFPDFVGDLLEGVFDANLKVTLTQMETYTDLLKEATKSLADYVRDIDDDEAFVRLADRNRNQFGLNFANPDKPTLTDSTGAPVNTNDGEVRSKIVDAKLELAAERRALLRETILMGISRLVVEKGTVKANVSFNIRAMEQISKSDEADENTDAIKTRWKSKGVWGSRGRTLKQRRVKQITVASTDSNASTDLAAKMEGSVEIQFKSDYFKLDNFASMYGELSAGQSPSGGQPPTLPAGGS